MRAKFISDSLNEKFKEESDPIKDMRIGYGEKQINSKTWKILEFIGSKGKEGAGLTEIQHFIWTKLDRKSEQSFWETDRVRSYRSPNNYHDVSQRKSRGHWNTQLFGGMHYHEGILHKYCEKNPKTKKWVLTRMPKPGEIIYDWPKWR